LLGEHRARIQYWLSSELDLSGRPGS